jgi:deoxyribodipyrimidine photo-lyase
MTTAIHWFRRDLRLLDNTALSLATREMDEVIGLFVLDPQLLESKDTAPVRVAFLYTALRALAKSLEDKGGRLIVRRGDYATEISKLVRETGADAVYFNRDYTSYARRRDDEVTTALEKIGCTVVTAKDLVIIEKDELLTGNGNPYTVYTPFKRRWLAIIGENPPTKSDPRTESLKLSRAELKKLDSLPIPEPPGDFDDAFFQPATEDGGRKKLAHWAGQLSKTEHHPPIEEYAANRNFPALEQSTSRLSSHLRMGTISPAMCYRAAVNAREYASTTRQKDGCDAWIGELIWRDFYYQIMWNFPYVAKGAFQKKFDALKWETSRDKELLEAWCAGQTGYPIVDAAMRQMNNMHWMHNRLRMIVASFMTKDLLLNWQLGELYFKQKLVDYDQPSNNGGWQWAASTGTDAQPYFRIFNPASQSQKFDAKGDFIRHWLPELARVPDKYIHEPHLMPVSMQQHLGVIIGKNYPTPIVDHKIQRDKALAMYKAL